MVETDVTVADLVMVEGTVTVVVAADLAHEEVVEPKVEGVTVTVEAEQVALEAGRVVVTVTGDADCV